MCVCACVHVCVCVCTVPRGVLLWAVVVIDCLWENLLGSSTGPSTSPVAGYSSSSVSNRERERERVCVCGCIGSSHCSSLSHSLALVLPENVWEKEVRISQ